MSAFMCSADHINALAAYAQAYLQKDARTTAALLTKANVASVRALYEDRHPDMTSTLSLYVPPAKPPRMWDPVVILKLCACYDYQACDAPDYDQSAAAKLLTQIRDAAIGNLPGYDAAPWGI